MAQLDRLLSVMVSNRANGLLLNEGEVAQLDVPGGNRPVTKQPLTAQQVVMLLREIAPADAGAKLDAGQPAVFQYSSDDGVFVARAMQSGGKWEASVRLDDDVAFAQQAGAAPNVAERPAARPTPMSQTPVNGNGHRPTPAMGATNGAAKPVPNAIVADPRAKQEIDSLLTLMVQKGGSDLHLRVGEPPVLRLHGEMVRIEGKVPLTNDALEAMLHSIMPDRNRGEYGDLWDTDYAYEIEGVARFRANAARERKGAAAVFRTIPAQVVTVEQMGVTPEVQQLCYLTKGLVLVTGPTGSGKSTTLCSLIDLVNRSRNDHVITIEDPIEFVHPNKNCIITQRQVGVHTKSFKSALRAALREDPDIILVGELRDLETVAIAIETAETGHLVFGTLHTTTAAGTVDRIIDQFPADRQEQIRVMLADSLKGVISQTLCKKIGGGRVAAREILLTIPAISNLIRESKVFQINSVLQTSRKLGMITLNDALIDLVDGKLVEPKEAYMKAIDKPNFANMLRQRNHDVSFLDIGQEDAGAKAAPKPAAAAGRPVAAAGGKR
ncbi:MAG TPA: type IV pilus twitching motility protein PilT [Gemmatimonadaceae bacterium]|nr:type IV pilus twitching motility protein PilT [Gemmatimonadaceae bacterium]